MPLQETRWRCTREDAWRRKDVYDVVVVVVVDWLQSTTAADVQVTRVLSSSVQPVQRETNRKTVHRRWMPHPSLVAFLFAVHFFRRRRSIGRHSRRRHSLLSHARSYDYFIHSVCAGRRDDWTTTRNPKHMFTKYYYEHPYKTTTGVVDYCWYGHVVEIMLLPSLSIARSQTCSDFVHNMRLIQSIFQV